MRRLVGLIVDNKATAISVRGTAKAKAGRLNLGRDRGDEK